MNRKSSGLTIKVPYSSGWVVVSTSSGQVKEHAKSFADIVAKADNLSATNHVIMAASKSYRGHIMVALTHKE